MEPSIVSPDEGAAPPVVCSQGEGHADGRCEDSRETLVSDVSAPLADGADVSERDAGYLARLVALGDQAHDLAHDSLSLAQHEPELDHRAKLVTMGTKASETWIKLYDKEREVRGRLAGRK